jgi:hypothetical protein
VATRVVDEDPPHDLRRSAEEVSAIPPINGPLVDESHVDLVDQGGWLKCVADALASKLTCRDPPQLRVHEREQLTERGLVAATPVSEERRDIAGRWHGWVVKGFAADRIGCPEFNGKNPPD